MENVEQMVEMERQAKKESLVLLGKMEPQDLQVLLVK